MIELWWRLGDMEEPEKPGDGEHVEPREEGCIEGVR